jgi:hypothetical protein
MNAGFPAALLGMAKGIRKPFPKFLHSLAVTVHRHGFFMVFSTKGPQIIQSVKMIRMGMGQKHRIQPSDTRPNGLKPEFRPRINHRSFSFSAFYIKGRPHPLIPRVFRTTYRTPATYYRNAVGRTRTKDKELHNKQYGRKQRELTGSRKETYR